MPNSELNQFIIDFLIDQKKGFKHQQAQIETNLENIQGQKVKLAPFFIFSKNQKNLETKFKLLTEDLITNTNLLVINDNQQNTQTFKDLQNNLQQSQKLFIVSSNPEKFEFKLSQNLQMVFQNYQKHYIMFATESQDIEKKRKIENHLIQNQPQNYYISLLQELFYAIEFLIQHENNPQTQILNVGYYMTFKKIMQNYERSDLLIPQFPMKYTPIDFRDSYENLNFQQNQQKQQDQQNTPLNIDVLLHKITQHIEHLYTSDPSKQNLKKNAEKLMQNFYKFTDLYKKQVAIIDRMEKFEQIQNRGEFQKIFQAALTREQKFSQLQIKKNIIVKTPPYLEISAEENKISNFESICAQIEKKVGYPVIIKNREASAVANSHQMAVVLNQEGIPGVLQAPQFQNMPIIIQKLIQHDGKIFKIYCMGDFTDKQVRPSIPNITQDIIDNQKEKFWLFNSQKSFQEQLPLDVPLKIDNKDEITDNLDQETVVLVKDTLIKTFNFTVFGYDVLQEKKINENGEKEEIWYICDMNYFPSFKDITNMIQHFKNHFQNQKNLLNNHK